MTVRLQAARARNTSTHTLDWLMVSYHLVVILVVIVMEPMAISVARLFRHPLDKKIVLTAMLMTRHCDLVLWRTYSSCATARLSLSLFLSGSAFKAPILPAGFPLIKTRSWATPLSSRLPHIEGIQQGKNPFFSTILTNPGEYILYTLSFYMYIHIYRFYTYIYNIYKVRSTQLLCGA